MEILLTLTYAAIVYVIFKVFKVPLNKWTLPSAVLGGVVMLGALILTMNYNHPYTEDAQKLVVGIPVVPQVTGVVSEVTDKINTPIKKEMYCLKSILPVIKLNWKSLKRTLLRQNMMFWPLRRNAIARDCS